MKFYVISSLLSDNSSYNFYFDIVLFFDRDRVVFPVDRVEGNSTVVLPEGFAGYMVVQGDDSDLPVLYGFLFFDRNGGAVGDVGLHAVASDG